MVIRGWSLDSVPFGKYPDTEQKGCRWNKTLAVGYGAAVEETKKEGKMVGKRRWRGTRRKHQTRGSKHLTRDKGCYEERSLDPAAPRRALLHI